MTFQELMSCNPPRVVVKHKLAPDGTDNYQWGVVGAGVPLLSLVGHVSTLIHRLSVALDKRDAADCLEYDLEAGYLVVAYDEREKRFYDFLHPDVPMESLVGMLECIKESLVVAKLGQVKPVVGQSPIFPMDQNQLSSIIRAMRQEKTDGPCGRRH